MLPLLVQLMVGHVEHMHYLTQMEMEYGMERLVYQQEHLSIYIVQMVGHKVKQQV